LSIKKCKTTEHREVKNGVVEYWSGGVIEKMKKKKATPISFRAGAVCRICRI